MNESELLKSAKSGDIQAFHRLFSPFQEELKSYLFRLSADRNLIEDVFHDVFILAFDKLKTFRQKSTLKTWVFAIATNLLRNKIKREFRWRESTQEDLRKLAYADPASMALINDSHRDSAFGRFEIQEHIDYCLTCVGKVLPLEQQVGLLLKEIYEFKVSEIMQILNISEAKVKHLVRDARQTMQRIFDNQCALVNKNGACFQCSGLNKKFNPKADTQAELMKIRFYKQGKNKIDQKEQNELLDLRFKLAKTISLLKGKGSDLHDAFFKLARAVNK